VAATKAVYRGAAQTLRDTDYADACPIATVALEVASTNETLREVTAEVFEEWLAGATTWFQMAGLKKSKARQLATMLVAALEGGFVLSRAAKSTAPLEAVGAIMTDVVRRAMEEATKPAE
jgi:hypothetical protein